MIDSRANPNGEVLLLVEDNPGDVRLAREALRDSGLPHQLYVAENGRQALDFLRQQGDFADAPRPALILLDLNLPGISGLDVLQAVKTDLDLRRIPITVLTSSESPDDIAASYAHRANAYISKPSDPTRLVEILKAIDQWWLHTAIIDRPGESLCGIR